MAKAIEVTNAETHFTAAMSAITKVSAMPAGSRRPLGAVGAGLVALTLIAAGCGGGGGGGTPPQTTRQCSGTVKCTGSTASYQSCIVLDPASVCTATLFVGSDNTEFACASCGDCMAAALKAAAWCTAQKPDMADSCAQGTQPMNSIGVGKPCKGTGDCPQSGPGMFPLCSGGNYCSFPCTSAADTSCKESASCVCDQGACFCVPAGCKPWF